MMTVSTKSTKSVKISIDDQYERNAAADFSSIDHVLRFSVEEIHRLIAPSWYTSKNIEDYNAEEDDDDIVQEVIQESAHRDFGFSYNDFINYVYEKSVSDFILNVGFLSSTDAEYCVKFIEDKLFRRWVEREMADITDVKIVVLIRKEANGEELPEHEFDGEFTSVQDDDVEEQVEMAPAPAPAQVEVEQEVIQIEDDEEEEEVPVVEEDEDGDEASYQLMEMVFGTNDYMEVEGIDYDPWLMEDDGEGGLEIDYGQWLMEDDGGGGIEEQQQWEEYVEEEEDNNYWFGLSNRNGVSRDMIEALLKTREYDPKRDGECVICMDGFSSKHEEVVAAEMPCSHVFHKPCIVEWLELKNSCPLCRFEICNKDDDPH